MVRYTEPFKTTFDKAQDSFKHLHFAVAPCIALAFLTNILQGFDFMEMLWVFSIYLEALAIQRAHRYTHTHCKIQVTTIADIFSEHCRRYNFSHRQ